MKADLLYDKKTKKIHKVVSIGIVATLLSVALLYPGSPVNVFVLNTFFSLDKTFPKATDKLSGYDVIIDIRSEEEYENGHINNALNVPLNNTIEEWGDYMLQHYPLSKNYLVYCNDGGLSKNAAELMTNLGFTSVYYLKEGMVVT